MYEKGRFFDCSGYIRDFSARPGFDDLFFFNPDCPKMQLTDAIAPC
jgi:hypothetical protein